MTTMTTIAIPAIQKVQTNGKQDMTQVQAIIQKPVKYLENVFGQDIRADPRNRDYDVQMSFYPKHFGVERMNTGALPYATSPRLRRNPTDRMMPIDTKTRFSRACFNECLNSAGPHYLRYWPIWDHMPFLPTGGDVALDPRYGANTKQFTEPYLVTRGGAPRSL